MHWAEWLLVLGPLLPVMLQLLAQSTGAPLAWSIRAAWAGALLGIAGGGWLLWYRWIAPAARLGAWLHGGGREAPSALDPRAFRALAPLASALAQSPTGQIAAIHEEIRTGVKTGEYLVKTAEDLSGTLDRLSHSAGSVRTGERLLESDIAGVHQTAEELSGFVQRVSVLLEKLAASYDGQVMRLETTLDLVFTAAGEMATRKEAATVLSARSEELRQSLRARAESLERLCALSEHLSGSVAEIAELAERTQILAVNAAIEAARAGQWGRGFAVVAGEIRKFSDETALLVEKVQASFKNLAEGAGEASVMVAEASAAIADVAEKTGGFAMRMEAMSGQMNEAARCSREVSTELEHLSGDSRTASGESLGAVERALSLSGIASRVKARFGENDAVVETVLEDVSRLSNGVERIASIGRNQAASSRRLITRVTAGTQGEATPGPRTGSASLRLVTAAWPPYVYEQDGLPAGVDAEILAEVGRRLKRELKIEFLPWDNCIDMVKTRDADGIFSLNRTPEREGFLAYPEEHNFDSASVFFARKDSPIVFERFSDLVGRRIGIIEGYSYEGGFTQTSGIHLEPASSDETNLKRLVSGAIDLAVADRLVGLHLARGLGLREALDPLPKPLNSTKTFLAFSRAVGEDEARKRASAYTEALAAMKRDGTWQRILAAYS